MGSTSPLRNSAGSAVKVVVSAGPPSPPSQPHGRCRCQLRPCERNSGQNAPNWNHRTNNSPVYSAVGTKPPMSVPQNGSPDNPLLMATGTWVLSVSHREATSPDHTKPPYRCTPADAFRCSANGRSFGRNCCVPSQYIRWRLSSDGPSYPS